MKEFEDLGDWGFSLRTRESDDLAFEEDDALLLPYAPYDNEEKNRQYRQSNHIKERG